MLKYSLLLARLACVKNVIIFVGAGPKSRACGLRAMLAPPGVDIEGVPMQAPAVGRYRHFKGGYYQVLTLALHTETGEQLVIYQSEQDGAVYARPVAMFMEWIEHQGEVVSRFTPVAG